METINFFLAPFAMMLILSGIHCYLGIHVLKREIIFIDLSLAQVAALGSALSLLFGIEHHSIGSYFFALGCTFFAAALFSWAKKFEKIISQETLIGIIFAFSSATIILVVDQLAHGAEHIKESLIGKILWVSWEQVLSTLIIYTLVSIIHYIFRKKFMAISNHQNINQQGLWNFLFYALFGVIITSSTSTAGILLVFVLLVVPASISKIIVGDQDESILRRLIVGWIISAFLTILGFYISFKYDYPAGATLVSIFTMSSIIILPLSQLRRINL